MGEEHGDAPCLPSSAGPWPGISTVPDSHTQCVRCSKDTPGRELSQLGHHTREGVFLVDTESSLSQITGVRALHSALHSSPSSSPSPPHPHLRQGNLKTRNYLEDNNAYCHLMSSDYWLVWGERGWQWGWVLTPKSSALRQSWGTVTPKLTLAPGVLVT